MNHFSKKIKAFLVKTGSVLVMSGMLLTGACTTPQDLDVKDVEIYTSAEDTLKDISSSLEDLNQESQDIAEAIDSDSKKKIINDENESTEVVVETSVEESFEASKEDIPEIIYGGDYYTKEDVSLYIFTYEELPPNFITKKEAKELGWSGGSLEEYAPGKCIGGDTFGNREGILPSKKGRKYTECDIDTLGAKKRGAKRIVFSNDGLIYYTEDHYESFELLYGEE